MGAEDRLEHTEEGVETEGGTLSSPKKQAFEAGQKTEGELQGAWATGEHLILRMVILDGADVVETPQFLLTHPST